MRRSIVVESSERAFLCLGWVVDLGEWVWVDVVLSVGSFLFFLEAAGGMIGYGGDRGG